MHGTDAISTHFRLIPTQVSALKRLGLHTIDDLLRHFPSRYETLGTSAHASALVPGAKVTLFGTLSKLKAKKLWKSRRNATEGWFEDTSGRVKVMWFNQPYIHSYVPEGTLVKMTGTVGGSAERPYIANPEVEVLSAGVVPEAVSVGEQGLFEKNTATQVENGIFPVYPESRGVTSRWFFHAMKRVFEHNTQKELEDPIPEDIRARYNLPDLATALIWIHAPEKVSHAEAARKRFAFEEIFAIQIARARERAENDAQASFPITEGEDHAERFLSTISFPPTSAQSRAIGDILNDFKKRHPMARLLEGDVGSGKTLVAAAAAYAVVNSRPPQRTSGTLQVAYMAPTEILAGQHFQSFIEYFKHLPINIGLITGSGCKKFPSKLSPDGATDISRAQLLKWVANGEIAMLVGTHALIQKSVQFQHLALCVVDEQHRFGTRQRRALSHKGDAMPHFLSMTATPIPRTLALTLYGDLDISLLDELPPGRAKITTELVKPAEREKAYKKIREQLLAGRQAYVICPRIEEPDPANMNALQAKSAKAEAKRLKKDIFPEFDIGLLHGAMPAKGGSQPKADGPRMHASSGKPNKEQVMKDFADGKINILVATSVVEVGINVPNATVILIEGAERFGLAQLHQLRGRVQRSSHPPHCFLLPESTGPIALKRLKALERSSDGFKLAEADLEARGAGDLFGRQQWGVTDLGMEALKNLRLIRAARDEAHNMITADASLKKYPALLARIEHISQTLHSE